MSTSRQSVKDKIIRSLEFDTVKDRELPDEVKQSFLDYAMSVITSRALPDLKDGLKPVHRRIIYSAYEEKLFHDRKYKKSAALVGKVMGAYHPHGDASIYEALVRMSQDFSLRYPLIEGQGNFGSIDGDAPAAMRYTEARLSKMGEYFLEGIEEECVDWMDNYDQSKKEPIVLPTLIPNILLNGSTGIAVGLATNIPPHNLSEVVDAILAYIKDPAMTPSDIYKYLKGPDFPTAGEILRYDAVKDYFENKNEKRKKSFLIRSKIEVEESKGKRISLIIREIPYGIKKVKIIERIVSLITPNKKTGNVMVPVLADNIVDIRDESNLEGIRIVIECKVGTPAQVIINNLYKYTQLQHRYSPNLTLLINGEPRRASMLEVIELYFHHQMDMLRKRTTFQLKKLEARLHILEGRLRISEDILEAVKVISTSNNPDEDLKSKYSLDDIQLEDILKFPIGRLKKLSIKNLREEKDEKLILKKDKEEILGSEERQKEELYRSLEKIKRELGDERRTRINLEDIGRIEHTDLHHFVQSIFALTKKGYITQMSLEEFKVHRRGGSGSKGASLREGDQPMMILACFGKDNLLFFTNKGKVYRTRPYEMNLGKGKDSKGKFIGSILGLAKDEKVITMISIKEEDYEKDLYLFFATSLGRIKRHRISDFKKVNANGKIAMKLLSGDSLKFVIKVDNDCEVCLASSFGKLVRFKLDNVQKDSFGRNVQKGIDVSKGRDTIGVIGIDVRHMENNKVVYGEVISASSTLEGKYVLSISENGIGKLSKLEDFRLTSRGRKKGVSVQAKETDKSRLKGKTMGCFLVDEDDHILLMTNTNKINRFNVRKDFFDEKTQEFNTKTRSAQGVRLIEVDYENKERVIYWAKNSENNKELEEIKED